MGRFVGRVANSYNPVMSVGRGCRSWGSETISHPGHGYHHQGPSSMDGKQGKGPARG